MRLIVPSWQTLPRFWNTPNSPSLSLCRSLNPGLLDVRPARRREGPPPRNYIFLFRWLPARRPPPPLRGILRHGYL